MENIYKVCVLGIFKHPIMCGEKEAMLSSVKSLNPVSDSLNSHVHVLSSSTASRWRVQFTLCTGH